jgi:hypothetical protein
MKTQFLALALM